jgi:cell division control protein 6
MGLVNAKVVSQGRYGRTKKIRLEISRTLIRDVFGDDARFELIMAYKLCTSKKSRS